MMPRQITAMKNIATPTGREMESRGSDMLPARG
jgi:hypothetical protein